MADDLRITLSELMVKAATERMARSPALSLVCLVAERLSWGMRGAPQSAERQATPSRLPRRSRRQPDVLPRRCVRNSTLATWSAAALLASGRVFLASAAHAQAAGAPKVSGT